MLWFNDSIRLITQRLRQQRPDATARMRGSVKYPHIRGNVYFYQTGRGVLVVAQVDGLPRGGANKGTLPNGDGSCDAQVFGFHIHEGTGCTSQSNPSIPFSDAKGHYNPNRCAHPHHAGDLPPLFGNNGSAWSAVMTDRFLLKDVIGRTVIVHRNPDDFTSQPSGNAGEMIACGVIGQR